MPARRRSSVAGPTRSRRPRARRAGARRDARAATLIAAALATLVLGAVIGRATAPHPVAPLVAPSRRSDEARGHALARGSQRSPAGAVATATGFLDALRWDVLVDDRRRSAVVARFATAGARAALEAAVARPVAGLRRAVAASPVVARPVFVGYRVARFTRRRARVSVWGIALFATGVYGPVSQWSTTTFDLARQDGSWKVAGLHSRPGPSPRWSLGELAREVAAFEEFGHVP